MLKSFILTLVIFAGGILLIVGCDNTMDFDERNVLPEERDPRFVQCYFEEDLAKNACDSVLTSFFGVPASSHLKLNDELSFIGCDEGRDLEMLSFGDDNCCIPRTYDLVYDVMLGEDTICQIPMVAGSEMKFDFISADEKKQLEGYKLLLSEQLDFDYKDLTSFMKDENMNPAIYDIELVRDTLLPKEELNAYSWEISYSSGGDEMIVAHLNAMTGRYRSIRPITRLGD